MRKLHFGKILAVSSIFFGTVFQGYAQNDLRNLVQGENGVTKHFVHLAENRQIAFNSVQLKNILHLDAGSNLVLKYSESDELGVTHHHFYQTYNGIPVENSMYIVSTKSNKITNLSGEIILDFNAPARAKSYRISKPVCCSSPTGVFVDYYR